MLAKMGRPKLPTALQRDIRNGKPLMSRGPVKDRSGVSGLAPGWKETKGPDGRTYYFNAAGETRWEKPLAADGGSSRSSEVDGVRAVATTAVVVASKPVIPGVPDMAKLPRGWRMMTGADGKPYYFNKKTGATSWDPPPPVLEGEDPEPKDINERVSEVKDKTKHMLMSGLRAAKQVAAHGFKAKHSGDVDDGLLDAQYAQVLQLEMQMGGIKACLEAYLASLVEMCWSADQLATKFGDYLAEPGTVGQAAAAQAATMWKELQLGAQRSLEAQYTAKVLRPVADYLGEIEGLKKLHDERQKRLLDYDYYRRKVREADSNPRPFALLEPGSLCPPSLQSAEGRTFESHSGR
jgi:hypothetical protein